MNNNLSYKISYLFRLIHNHHQAVYKNKAEIFTVTWVYLKPNYNESVNIYFCPCNKTDDDYILGETCSFCVINKLVHSDRMYHNSDYNFYVDEERCCLCEQCPKEEYSSEGTHSKNHRLNNLAWNVAYYAKNFHETSNFLNDAAFLTQ